MEAILLDVDGVLHVSGEEVPGASDAIRRLRESGRRIRLVTNNTTRPRSQLALELRSLGFDVAEDDIETAPLAAARLLAGKRVLALTVTAIHSELEQRVELVGEAADAVLVGGADESAETGRVFAYENLNRAFAELRAGARLVALHKNAWWQTAHGPRLDSGAYVAGLEYATGVKAEVVGKPTGAYFESALAGLGADAEETVMVGDDVEADVGGAKAAGLRAILVRTGKFREEALEAAEPKPDAVVDSIADVPGALDAARA